MFVLCQSSFVQNLSRTRCATFLFQNIPSNPKHANGSQGRNFIQCEFCSQWFTKWIRDTEQRTQRQAIGSSQPRIDVRALASAHGDIRGLLSYLLSQDVPHLETLVDDLESKACSRCSGPVKEGYKHIILFAQDVITQTHTSAPVEEACGGSYGRDRRVMKTH